ncbi:MAG: hypothetical protein FD126_1636 [Elusimicrobia bacterium]|nr:MAG: hypothetical protein FD126_1636 [Elusimicrobiota bacterium]
MRHAALALLLAAPASALPEFRYTTAAELKAAVAESPAAPAVGDGRPVGASDVITEAHILVQAGKTVLFGHADTPEQAAAAAAYWTAALKPSGVEVGAVEYKNNFFTLPYKTADGRVLRYFLAEPKQFPPKDEAGLRANMAATLSALGNEGLTPVAARVVNLDFLLPTYAVLYLTQPHANPGLEKNLRVLKSGEDMDTTVFTANGIAVIQVPQPWLMVYIGPEAGYVSMAAKTEEQAVAKRDARRTYLEKAGKLILHAPISQVDMGDYKYLIEVYFLENGTPGQASAMENASQLAKATMCTLRTIEKDECVYSCNDGSERRTAVRAPDPWDPRGPVIACPQVLFPF